MNTIHHSTINTKPYKALFGINPRCGLAKELADNYFLQRGTSEMQEEVLEEMLHEGSTSEMHEELEDEGELLNDIQEDDLENLLQEDFPAEVVSDNDTPAPVPAKRVRFQLSDDEDEQDHPAKIVRLQARKGIDKLAARMVARSSKSLKKYNQEIMLLFLYQSLIEALVIFLM